jgi:hypothetical protein
MKRWEVVAGVLAVVTVVAACGVSGRSAGDPSADASAATDVADTPSPTPRGQTPYASPRSTPRPSGSPSPSPVAILVTECEHSSSAYRVQLPSGWSTNPEFHDAELGRVSACRFFPPSAFDVTAGDRERPIPQSAAIWMDFLDDSCVGYISEVLERRQMMVDGYPAIAEELGRGTTDPSEPFTYQYVVSLSNDRGCEDGAQDIYALTNRDMAGSYEENTAVLDQMMQSLEVVRP